MRTKLWVLTPEEAERFFEMSLMKEAVTQEEKMKILNDMKVPTAEFAGSPDELTAKLANHANVIRVKPKERKRG